MLALSILAALVALGAITLGNSLKIVKQYERGVVYRLGRVNAEPRPPGMTAIVPFVDKLEKVNLQIVTMPIPAQEGITRDNVTVRVDAVIYFKVVDPRKAVVDVEDYQLAVGQVAQTSLRSIIGQSELDDLLTNRERLNQGLAIMIDSPAVDWGVHIDRVEIKDVALPETMKRSMSRQAEAERERRSRVIIADGELQASNKLAQASEAMAHTPSALQLRLLQTIVEVASERNSTLVLPFPVELLRFLENNTPTAPPTTEAGAKSTTEAGVTPTTDTPAEAVDRSESDTTPSAPADLDAIVQAMSESLKLTGLMPEQERVTSDMPEQERTTSDAAARSDVADQEEHFGHA
ncbi:regulator of protease activity HflC (stomatin/prohibitin superfamily) [Brevibacterium epidermidis]|jgi:regulator of protease activity HflC (stomatin/prohibitin superfamily)|uniref:Regulator of protease activity HflC (Stomatin/prohibitin superfamily) n=1 Tax=Brevibacterium epidermidis TaxID=1698 RepID=A0ABV4EK38_BREEP